MSVLRSEVRPLIGVPTPEIMANCLTAMVRPIVAHKLTVAEGPVLTADAFESQIADLVAARPNLSARGLRKAELVVRWIDTVGTGVPMTGALRTYGPAAPELADAMLTAILETAQTLHAPFSFVDQFDDSFRDRERHHVELYQQDKTGGDRVFGLFRGFSGIPWRTLLGPASVAFFGSAALEALPDSLAQQIDTDYWLLRPCADVGDWTPGAYCDGERQIIDTLGPDRFFDPATGTLPTVLPSIPELADIAVKGRQRDDAGEWIWHAHNGYPKTLL